MNSTRTLPLPGRSLNAIWQTITYEEGFNVLLLFLFLSNGYINLPFSVLGHGLLVTRTWTAAFWIGSIAAFAVNRGRIHWELWTIRLFTVYVVFSCASVTWSTAPLSTTYVPFIDSIALWMYCNYIIDRFHPLNFLRILIWTITIAMVLSIIYALAFPRIGIEQEINVGAWKGAFTQKNTCGLACTISYAICLGFRATNRIDRIWRVVCMLLTLIVVYKSESRESWIVMLALTGLSAGFAVLRRLQPRSRIPVVIAMGSILAATVMWFFYHADVVLNAMGRDRTLTGRTTIWKASIILIKNRPWFGYGIYGVWGRPISWPVVVRNGWMVTSAHNTFLESLLSVGIVGSIIFASIIVVSLLFVFRAVMSYDLRIYEVYIYLIASMLLLGLVISNMTTVAGVSLPLLVYSVSNLEMVERSGFMRLKNMAGAL